MSETTLKVEGMTCPSCIRHVNAALRGVAGVREVEVKLREGTVVVQHALGLGATPMIAALAEAGYPAGVR